MAQVISIPVRSYRTSFDNADLEDGVLTLNHKLGQLVVSVSIYDADGQLVDSTPVLVDTTSCTVELSNMQPLTGTWSALVCS